ncbi:MAG: DMT family transporter [Deferribacteres bacterium]|nr:DMT family transporter [candidate division KSB1 bacterium]MCB9500504.1 DMT family transporter [Deferribacteres bacterium]
MYKFAPFFVVLAAVLWGVDGIILRPALYGLPVALVVFLETTSVSLILTPFLFRKLKAVKNLQLMDFLAFFVVAAIGGVAGIMAITKALFYVNYINLSIVVLIQKLQPVFAIVLAALLLREKPSPQFILWAILAIGGAYLMTFGLTLPNFHTGDKTTEAAGYALLAAASFGCSTVFSKRALKNVEFEFATYFRFLIASTISFIIVLFMGYLPEIPTISKSQWSVLATIVMTIGVPAVFLYYYGLKRIKASVATICELAFPMTAVILEYFVHEKLLSWIQWLGVFLLLLSIIRVTRMQHKRR